ncbi:MAG: (Fe-S)-binding protein [Actinomycetia bacterium]|nr:(Fe-S)-binding protein [Actinomycetes bacterium]
MSTTATTAVEAGTREIFEGVGTGGKVVFYGLTALAIGAFVWGWWRRIAKYRRGRPAERLGWWESLNRLGVVASNSTVARGDRSAGAAHFLLFWGFITLFIGTVILTIDEDIVKIATRQLGEEQSFFKGAFYQGYSTVLDTMGLATVFALGFMALRRARFKLPKLDYERAEQPEGGYSRHQYHRGDQLFVALLGLVLVTGFLHEGFRIRASDFPDFEVWSPVGWVLARLISGIGIEASASDTVRTGFWWVHTLLALGFVAYIPYSKAMHMLTDAVNLVAHDATSSRSLPAPVAGAAHLGYRTVEDFTWKELLDFDSCTKCGRCHVVCPAHGAGAPLSPRDLILDLRQWAESRGGSYSLLDHEQRPTETGPLSANGVLVGQVIGSDTLWSCTTCMACVAACPVGIEQVPTIVELRRSLVEEGEMEPTLQDALQNIAQKGNSFGKSARQRARWTKGLDFKIPDARKESVRYLWFVGDFASFDDRLQDSSRTFANVLHNAGVDFGLLYEGERNAGNDVRRVGEEGLFDMLVEQNLEALAGAHYDEIVTTDPHTLNTLRNEYPAHGLDKPVRHYTEVLADLLQSGQLKPAPLRRRVTYHDPCYLARYNQLTDAPRRVLAAIGCELIEMPRNRESSFCCGAGGGRIWMDDSTLVERPSENRIQEAAELGIDAFVVACPKDFTMFSDAAKTTGHDDQIAVVDMIQLVADAIETEPVAATSLGEESGS